MQETQVRAVGQEDPLEKEMATHSRNLAWENPKDRGAWQATVHGVGGYSLWGRRRVRHDWTTKLQEVIIRIGVADSAVRNFEALELTWGLSWTPNCFILTNGKYRSSKWEITESVLHFNRISH